MKFLLKSGRDSPSRFNPSIYNYLPEIVEKENILLAGAWAAALSLDGFSVMEKRDFMSDGVGHRIIDGYAVRFMQYSGYTINLSSALEIVNLANLAKNISILHVGEKTAAWYSEEYEPFNIIALMA